MTPHAKVAIGGVIVGLILLATPIPWWVVFALIVIAIAAPAAAWMALDPEQRRRFKEIRRRQLNR